MQSVTADKEFGYPTNAAIIAKLRSLGLEWLKEGKQPWSEDAWEVLWSLVNFIEWAGSLGVYIADANATTFNVRGGSYCFGGQVKTYVPGDAIDPANNDVTYVWMEPDGTVDSGIDGDGWPATDHIKLAEVTVDSDGIITAVTDLRGQGFLRAEAKGRPEPFILKATLTAGSTVQVYDENAPFKFAVIDAWSIAKSADGGTWKLTDGTNDITDAVGVTATDKTINRAGTIDDAYNQIAASTGSLSVVGDGTLADVDVYILCIRVL
jgi:hypothetical protein